VLACVGRRCPCRRVRSWFRWSASGASGGRYRQVVKFHELIANAAIYSTALDITDVANALAAEGHPVDTDDLAAVTLHHPHDPPLRRLGPGPQAAPAAAPSRASTCSREYCSAPRLPDATDHPSTTAIRPARWGSGRSTSPARSMPPRKSAPHMPQVIGRTIMPVT
jgi:hypothetical protein